MDFQKFWNAIQAKNKFENDQQLFRLTVGTYRDALRQAHEQVQQSQKATPSAQISDLCG